MRQIILWGWLVISGQAAAHPHSFISMETTLVQQGQMLSGLSMAWTMDEMTSADLLYDAGNAQDGSVVWKKLAAEVMANVLTQSYFTEISRDSKPVKVKEMPGEYHLARDGHKAVLTFVLLFDPPQPLTGGALTFSTFDPSYFVDFTYTNQQRLHLPAALTSRCSFKLYTPSPDASLQAYALSLDKADAPPEDMDLGKQFAQRVTLQCH